MNHYFTISKFARLRGIDINSLRYYERLGILTPAYTDPHTRYRYYTAEQLSLLDMILLCINLGVPLKELKAYFDESGRFQNRALFEEGKRRTQEKIQELQSSLRSIEHTLTFLEDTARYTQKNTPYRRMIPRRRLVTAPYDGNMNDVNALETAFAFAQRLCQGAAALPRIAHGHVVPLYRRRVFPRRVLGNLRAARRG